MRVLDTRIQALRRPNAVRAPLRVGPRIECAGDVMFHAVTGAAGTFFFGTRMKRRAKRTMFGIVVGRSRRLS